MEDQDLSTSNCSWSYIHLGRLYVIEMIARKKGSQWTSYASPCSCEFYTTDVTTFLTNARDYSLL